MKIVLWAGKIKGEGQIRKEKKEKRIATEVSVVLAGLGLIELGVKKPKKAATEVRELRKTAMGEGKPGETVMARIKGLVFLSSSAFLLLPISLLLSAFSIFRRTFFLVFDKCF